MNEKLEELMHNTMIEAREILERAKNREEVMAINGSLLAVVQDRYVKFMGNKSTAHLFYAIADKLAIMKD